MGRDWRGIIESLLLKTVSRGCTAPEAAAAAERAKTLAAKHGINLDSCRPRDTSAKDRFYDSMRRGRGRTPQDPFQDAPDFSEILRRARERAERAERERQWKAGAGWGPQSDFDANYQSFRDSMDEMRRASSAEHKRKQDEVPPVSDDLMPDFL